jgi:putative ABC transport system substrate-binding protein
MAQDSGRARLVIESFPGMPEAWRPRPMNNWIVVSLLAILIVASGHSVAAQQPEKVRRIGYLSPAAQPSAQDEVIKQGLHELGWMEGQNIRIEYRWAGGKGDRLPALAEELVRLNVDLIIAWTTPAIRAAKNATRTIPIVMAVAADPVAAGFVASLARPGGNITGVSSMAPDFEGKRLELLRELVPRLSRVAFLAYGGDPIHRLFVKEAQDAGPRLGIQVQPLVVKGPEEFDNAFSAMTRERAGALVVQSLFMIALGHGPTIADLAVKHRLPTLSDGTQFTEVGGLISYGADRLALTRLVAPYVDKILKGAKPAEVPVVQPRTFQLGINLQTAKRLGLPIPQSVLFRADKVIN